jgi:hypothetical protein
MDSESVVVWFPIYSIKIIDKALNENLLLREHITLGVVEVEKLYTELL